MKDIVQKTCEIGDNEVQMGLKRSEFLVKNFTEANIVVTLGNNEVGNKFYGNVASGGTITM